MLTKPPTEADHVALATLLRSIRATAESILYLEPLPASDAIALECIANVDRAIRQHGGSRQLGWRLGIWPHVFAEAEFHCVWRDTAGRLHDVSPAPWRRPRVAFVADDSLRDTGRQIDNVRVPLKSDRMVEHFIRLAEARFEFMNRGVRATQTGLLRLSGDEAREWQVLQQMSALVQESLARDLGSASPCLCGSLRPYVDCHGGVIADWLGAAAGR